MAKKGKSKKNALPQEFVDAVNRMSPGDLSQESARADIALEISKEDLKNDDQINKLKEDIKGFKTEVENEDSVVKAQDALTKAVDEQTPTELIEAKENLKALQKAWNNELKDRKNKLKFMKKTLREHMRAGRLPSKMA